MPRANYEVVSVGINDEDVIMLLRDRDGRVSITNDAEAVVAERLAWYKAEFLDRGFNTGKKLIIHYLDTEGRRDQLLHDNLKFTGFAPVDP